MPKSKKKYVCVVGASAGGLDAISRLLAQLPEEKENLAVIVAQHLSPTHKSRLVDLLKKTTSWPVEEAKHEAKIPYGKVLITPPDKDISLESQKVVLSPPSSIIGPKPSVNVLFTSAAECFQERVIGVILSGSGSDGAAGIENIKMNLGYTLVQEPSESAYDGMPKAAIETGMVDLIFKTDEFGETLRQIKAGVFDQSLKADSTSMSDFEHVVNLLANRSKVDFSDYKEATIKRRLESRMNQLKINSLKAYLKKVKEKPGELEHLFNHVLIGVTQFFRDPHAFEALKEHLVQLIEAKEEKSLRIWVAGCATGEEPISIAILLHELLGERFNEYNIQIFATDIDEVAIGKARRGVFSKEAVELLPEHYVERYFQFKGEAYQLKKVLRSIILFSRHDVGQNPPFLKLDLVVCRNIMIYFKNDLQNQVIQTFHYSLHPGGLLFLGKSESLGRKEVLFRVLDKKNKLFASKGGARQRGVHLRVDQTRHQGSLKPVRPLDSRSALDKIKDAFSDVYHQPYVIIDEDQEILYMSDMMDKYLRFPKGLTSNNLFKLIREEFEIFVRSAVTSGIKNDREVLTEVKKYVLKDQPFLMRVVLRPITGHGQAAYFVIFEELPIGEDLVLLKDSKSKKGKSIHYQALESELAQTKEHLQTYIEELETSNEEMQSLNEELQSSNEELQSSNEELETTNEELQSTNEELQIAFSELKDLNEEIKDKDQVLRKVYDNVRILMKNELQGFLLIDHEYKIIEFNERAFDLIKTLKGTELVRERHMVDFLPERMTRLFFQFIRFSDNELPISTKVTIPVKEGGNTSDSIHLKLNFTHVTSEDGTQHTTVGMLDVTKEEEAERTLNELNAQLQVTNRDLENFAYAASHDLLEPIRLINKFAALVSNSLPKEVDNKKGKYLQHIEENSHLLTKMIKSLLEYSKLNMSSFAKEKADLSHLLDLAKVNLKNQIEEKDAEVTILNELPVVQCAKPLMIKAFQSLIQNALQYNNSKQPKVVVSAKEKDDFVELVFEDNGIGIPASELDQVFLLFKRSGLLKKEIEGSGIGLSIVKKIIGFHGGEIWAESDGKNGASFYLTLPK